MEKILIEVRGGVVTNIVSTQPVSITIIDWDNISRELAPDYNDLVIPCQPDAIVQNISETFENPSDAYEMGIYNAILKREKEGNSKVWICTDPDAGQFRLDSNNPGMETIFTFKQGDVINVVNLHEYGYNAIKHILSGYGYSPIQGTSAFIEPSGSILGNEIIAECIFEYNNDF